MGGGTPRVSIITPVYNRRELLPRALQSVAKQTFRDIELIVINDGSTEPLDDIVEEFMSKADFGVAYIKKPNGGVHTARNAGIRVSHGEMLFHLDSDDEILPDGIEKLVRAWDSIPLNKRDEYREVVAFYYAETQDGHRMGKPYPENINQLPYDEVLRIQHECKHGDQCALLRGDIMRANPWPEPAGVRFVTENILWRKLDRLYKSWFINDYIGIVHFTGVSISRSSTRHTAQHAINGLFRYHHLLNNRKDYGLTFKQRLIYASKYTLLRQILLQQRCLPDTDWVRQGLTNGLDRTIAAFAYLPAVVVGLIYSRKHKFVNNN